jgi:hypothetical protein
MDVNYLTGYHEPQYIGRKKGKGKFFKGVKKIALAAPRNAFRAIVSFNVRGLAKNLSQAVAKDSSKVKEFWEKLGGKFDGGDSLIQSINKGKDKKPLFGEKKGVSAYDDEPYLGFALEASVAAATPIILSVKKLLADLGIKPEDLAGLITPGEKAEADASGNKFDDANFTASDPEPGVKTNTTGLTTDFKISPLIIGGVLGAGVLIYLLTKKKRK